MDGMGWTLGRLKKPLPNSDWQSKQYIGVSALDGPGRKLPLRLGNSPEGNLMETGFAIWLLRETRNMTQSQVATRMKTSRQQVSDLEIGQQPTIATLLRVARALQISPQGLLLIAEERRRGLVPQLKRGKKHGFEQQTGQSTLEPDYCHDRLWRSLPFWAGINMGTSTLLTLIDWTWVQV
jgi:transcriptional regulator with XRE-family HTH domain